MASLDELSDISGSEFLTEKEHQDRLKDAVDTSCSGVIGCPAVVADGAAVEEQEEEFASTAWLMEDDFRKHRFESIFMV